MSSSTWRLPWTLETVPHAVLDIVRGCNVSCRACFNSDPPWAKTLAEVRADLDTLAARRPLSSLTILGGEVTLHPHLGEVVAMVRERGLKAEVMTNGVLLDAARARGLKQAGADIVCLHIEAGQTRPDLPEGAGAEGLRRLREEKVALLAREGIDAGLAVTAFEDSLEEVREAVAFTLDSPAVSYLLVTLHRDTAAVEVVEGDLAGGLRGRRRPGSVRQPRDGIPRPSAETVSADRGRADTLTNRDMAALLRAEFGLEPFAHVGSNLDPTDPRWLSYLVGTCQRRGGRALSYSVRPSAFERAALAILKRLLGRYPMYLRQSAASFRTQLLLNALTGGDLLGNLRFLGGSLGRSPKAKRFVFQCLAAVQDDGRVVHCDCCPDAVLRQGRLVPVCLGDCVVPGPEAP